MIQAITNTSFSFPKQTAFYKGKVRDVYTINNTYMVMIVSDRISAFDVVLPKGIPYKGQVLNQIASLFLDATKDIVPNWKLTECDPMVTIGTFCNPFPVEMVIRGYLSGHAWREYKEGKRSLCGVNMPEGMKENDKFPTPIITPTTKEAIGHDEDISKEDIIRLGLISKADYDLLEKYTYALFERGTEMAAKQGLILVDTKYEFGKKDEEIILIDEIHTPDSSRYFYKEGYEERQAQNKAQRQLSKEFVREWLIERNFQGKEGQSVPEMDDAFVIQVSERYIELFEQITGKQFIASQSNDALLQRIENNILKALGNL